MKNNLVLILISLLIFSSCINRSNRFTENQISKSVDIGDVTELSINGIIDLRLDQGDAPSLEIQGDEEAINALQINTSGKSLQITYDSESSFFSSVNTPRVILTLTDLTDLKFNGVGNFVMEDNFRVESIKISGSGVGNIELSLDAQAIGASFDMMGNVKLSGTVESMNLRNDGIGFINASELVAKKLVLNSSGIGKIDVNCLEELSISVNGIGSVSYSGNPTILKKEINGIGKVTEK